MALIDLAGIVKNFEAQKVLCGVDFTLEEGERVAIVGRNGSGKSTLMKIAASLAEADEGRIIVQNNISIEMLEQEPRYEAGLTVRAAIESALTELNSAKEQYDLTGAQLAKTPDDRELLARHGELGTFLDHHNAWNLEDKINRILKELNLQQFENQEARMLSGGEQRRVSLAKLLLKKPDILLLDEPTNHLDVGMVEFLEELLLNERFTLLFISHDRYFIDRLATRTIEIENGKLRSFKGGYADYLRQKEALLLALSSEHDNLLKLLKREEEWLSRGVKARLKRNEGRKERVMQLRQKAKTNPTMIRQIRLQLAREAKHFNGGSNPNRQKQLFELENVSLQLGGKQLIDNFSARILQKDRIAIVGPNGAGKSTLLKLLLGHLQPDRGKLKMSDVATGYFDQSRAMLDDDKNLTETFCPNGGDRVDVQGRNMHVYGYLKSFLFPKEFLDKKIGILSGGEKNRVALALLFAQKVDLLILDEPTNDLDIPTINILEEFIQEFAGAVLFVSHDRYFVDKIAQKLLVFKGNGEIEERYESYSEYLELLKELNELDEMEKEATQSSQPQESKPKQPQKAATKFSYKEKSEYEKLPGEIEQLEALIEDTTAALGDPQRYQEVGIAKLAADLESAKEALEGKIERYLELDERASQFAKE